MEKEQDIGLKQNEHTTHDLALACPSSSDSCHLVPLPTLNSFYFFQQDIAHLRTFACVFPIILQPS